MKTDSLLDQLKEYIINPLTWLFLRLKPQHPQEVKTEKKYFSKGQIVETRSGEIGKVWRIYREIKTGVPIGCSVMWEYEYKGDKISPFLPAENMGKEFNPIIRVVEA